MSSIALRAIFVLSLVAFPLGPVEAESGAAEFKPSQESLEASSSEPTGESVRTAKKTKGANFTRYTQSMRQICIQLDDDGRREAMFKMLEPLHEELPDCPGCKSFLRSFASVCKAVRAKPIKKKIEKKVDPEQANEEQPDQEHPDEEHASKEEPIKELPQRPLQREPSTKLIDTVSVSMIALSLDEKRAHDAAQAVEVLVAALRDPQGKTPGERDYFDILAAYFYSPFASLLEGQAEESLDHSDSEESEAPPVDDLFNL